MFSQHATKLAEQHLSSEWKSFLDERRAELDGKFLIGIGGNDGRIYFQIEDESGARYHIDKAIYPGEPRRRPIVYVGKIKFDGYNPVLVPADLHYARYENVKPLTEKELVAIQA